MIKQLKKIWTHSIQRQLIISIALIHAVLMTIFVFDLVHRQSDFLEKQSQNHTLGLCKTIATNSVSWVLAQDFVGMEEIILSQSQHPNLLYAMLISPQGKIMAHTKDTNIGLFISDSLSLSLLKKETIPQILVNNSRLIDIASPIFANEKFIGWARVGMSQQTIYNGLVRITKDGIWYTIFAIIVGSIFAIIMGRSITSGLRHLVKVANEIRDGNENARITFKRSDELGNLGKSLNLMIDSIIKQKNIISETQKELKDSEQKLKIQNDELDKKIEERTKELTESEKRYRKAQEIGSVGNWEYNIQTEKFWVSEQTIILFGLDINSNNFSIEEIEQCIPERKRVHQSLIDLIENNKPYYLEYDIITHDLHQRKTINSIAKSERDIHGNLLKITGVVRDITESKKAEQKLKESETQLKELNATKDKLFSIIAHDLKSPVSSLFGFSELLIKNIRTNAVEKSEKFIKNINSAAKQTLNLLDNLLDWSKSQTGQLDFKPENLYLQALIQETIEVLNISAALKKITIKSVVDNIVVYADQKMLETVLRNLVSNAIKFTDSGGAIEINAILEKNQTEITVSDNGVGMNEETISKLFRIDTTLTTEGTFNEKGSGLGLILCKEFVEKQGGKIWVESEVGKGSEFKFTMPLHNSTSL